MNPGHRSHTRLCKCHHKRVLPKHGKAFRCRITHKFCKSYIHTHWVPEGEKKQGIHKLPSAEKVSQVTKRVMMPKIVDRILIGSSESPIRRSEITQRYINLSREHRELIHRAGLWDFIWPFSRLNTLSRELGVMIESGIESRLDAENNMIRAQRRRMARAGRKV